MKILTNEEYMEVCEIQDHLTALKRSLNDRKKKVTKDTFSDVITRIGQLNHVTKVLEGLRTLEYRDLIEWTLWDQMKDKKVIELKTQPGPFGKILIGQKTAEVRLNDRDYHLGDILHLREWCPQTQNYTKRAILIQISDVCGLGALTYYSKEAVKRSGYVVLSFDQMQVIPKL